MQTELYTLLLSIKSTSSDTCDGREKATFCSVCIFIATLFSVCVSILICFAVFLITIIPTDPMNTKSKPHIRKGVACAN